MHGAADLGGSTEAGLPRAGAPAPGAHWYGQPCMSILTAQASGIMGASNARAAERSWLVLADAGQHTTCSCLYAMRPHRQQHVAALLRELRQRDGLLNLHH